MSMAGLTLTLLQRRVSTNGWRRAFSFLSFQERVSEVMKRSSTTGSDPLFSRQTYTKRSQPAFNHLTLILSWEERKENRHPERARGPAKKPPSGRTVVP